MKVLKVTLPFGITPHTEPMQNKQACTSGVISKKTMSHMHGWKSQAESPDLYPVEKIWGSMKTYLRDKYKRK